MAAYERAIGKVLEIHTILNTVKNDSIVLKSLCVCLYETVQAIDTIKDPTANDIAVLVGNNHLAVLEEICGAKNFTLSRTAMSLLGQIYRKILAKAPGYAVRSVATSMVSILNNKIFSNNSKECAVSILGDILLRRSFDCGSMITDAVNTILKHIRNSSDVTLRLACLKSLNDIFIGSELKIQDLHNETAKVLAKIVLDKTIEIRQSCAILIGSLAKYSSGCTSVSSDTLLNLTLKGLEDENANVQDHFCRATASIYVEQIQSYAEAQEKAKIGLARGGSTETAAPVKKSTVASLSRGLSISKLVSTQKKPVVEEFTLRTISSQIVKQIIKPVGSTSRASYITILGYLICDTLQYLEQSDYEWLLSLFVGLFRDPSITSLSYEDKVYFRTRISYIFRQSVTYNFTEALQVVMASEITQILAGAEHHVDDELQFLLNELNHLVKILGAAAEGLCDDIQMVLSVHLRHNSFGVRSAAAHIFLSFALISPAVGARFVSNSFANAEQQVKYLTDYNINDLSEDFKTSSFDESMNESTHSIDASRKKTIKDSERLQKMYCLHGNTLVISLLLTHVNSLPTGLPKTLILDLFQFGLVLLQQDVLTAPQPFRHVCCSVVRAGSLIISSCLNLGYDVTRTKLLDLLICCDGLIKVVNTSQIQDDDLLLFELMTVEAALVCIANTLWFCSESLIYERDCVNIITDNLDMALKAIKNKYQPKFRTNFRFRTLHVILLECYAWLTPAAYISSCQQIFVEALRVFRDSITAGYICTCLHDILPHEYDSLIMVIKSIPQLSYGLNIDVPLNEPSFMIRLESYAPVLQKKESEAVLGIHNKESNNANSMKIVLSKFDSKGIWRQPLPPSAQLDARTIDASIMVISSTFCYQSSEYKIKAMQLFSQALSQCLSNSPAAGTSSSSSLFSSDEEKKRKEKKNFVTIKNVISSLTYIVQSLPNSFYSSTATNSNDELSWFQVLVDRLIDVLGYASNIEVRCAASYSLSMLLSKLKNEDKFLEALIENLFIRVQGVVNTALEKKGEMMTDFGGYLLALGGLWCNIPAISSDTVQVSKKGGLNLRDRILACLLDCLRRVDTSVLFRAHGVMAFYDIIKHIDMMYDNLPTPIDPSFLNVILPLAVNVCTIIDIHSSAVNTSEDFEQLQIYIVRVLSLLATFSLKVFQHFPSRYEYKEVVVTCCRLWDSFQESPSHPLLKQELIQFLATILPQIRQGSDYDAVISMKYVAQILNNVIASRSSLTIETIRLAMDCVKCLISIDHRLIIQVGLLDALFVLLDWSIGAAPTTMTQGFSGLEFKTHFIPPSINPRKHLLQDMIQKIIQQLIDTDILSRPHQRITFWIMYMRAIGLNLRSTITNDTAADGGGDDEAGEAMNTMTKSSSKVASKGDEHMASYQQFIVKFRDYIIEKTHPLPPTRISVKLFSMVCASMALNHLYRYIESTPHHIDMRLARITTNQMLSSYKIQMNVGITDELFDTISIHTNSIMPCYMILFLHDVINYACALSSFTINDKRLLYIQYQSMLFLRQLINLFNKSIDVDTIQDANNRHQIPIESYILHQFISQLLSAVRPSLQETYSPNLISVAGDIIVKLIHMRYINDKVVIRRLFKSLLSYIETKFLSHQDARSKHLICNFIHDSNEISWELSIGEYIVSVTNIAKLFILSRHVMDQDIVEVIQSSIQEYLSPLHEIWLAIVYDAIRMKQSDTSQSVIWPQMTLMTDIRRGGFTYPSFLDMTILKDYYIEAFPILLAARSMNHRDAQLSQSSSSMKVMNADLSALQSSNVDLGLFTILFNHLREISDQLTRNMASYRDIEDDLVNMIDSLTVFSQSKPMKANESSMDEIDIITSHDWSMMLSYINQNLFPDLTISTRDSIHRYDDIYTAYSKLLHSLCHQSFSISSLSYAEDITMASSPLTSSLWRTSLTILLDIMPSLFDSSRSPSQSRLDLSKGLVVDISDTLSVSDINSMYSLSWPYLEGDSPSSSAQSSNPLDNKPSDLLFNVLNVLTIFSHLQQSNTHQSIDNGGDSEGVSDVMDYTSDLLIEMLRRVLLILPNNGSKMRVVQTIRQHLFLLGKVHSSLNNESNASKQPCLFGLIAFKVLSAVSVSHSYDFSILSNALGSLNVSTNMENIMQTYVETNLLLWTELLANSHHKDRLSIPTTLIEALYSNNPSYLPFKQILFHQILILNTSKALMVAGAQLIQYLVPSYLIILTHKVSDIEIIIVQTLLSIFATLDDANKGPYMSLILPSLCAVLSRSMSLESKSSQFIGLAMTHIARSNAEILREVISQTNDNDRLLLQNAMRITLQNQQAAEMSSPPPSGSISAPKKIDMNKFKK